MKGYQVFGSITAIIFATLLFLTLASNPPIHLGWRKTVEEIKPLDFNTIGRAISQYIWENFYMAFIALILVAVALAFSIVALLRRGE